MKIIFYGTRDYDHLYFDVLAADPDYGCTIKFLAANLDPDTAQLAAGGDAVCAFVNSDCGAETLSVLAKAGIKLLLMRCAGYNNVDLAAAKANGITVMRVPGYSPEAVAEHAMALLMELTRHAGALDMQVKQGDWDGADGFELFGKKLGIIGLGGIGQTVAGIANAFGMKVSAWNSHVPAQVFENLNVTPVEDMNELISNSDVVSVHMPLLDSTRGIITAKNLDALRPGTLFVNTARAEVIEPGALLARLQRGDIPAALDVFDHEPLAADDPLCKIPGIVLTPHIAWRTDGAYIGMTKQVVQSIAAFFKGEEFNVVV